MQSFSCQEHSKIRHFNKTHTSLTDLILTSKLSSFNKTLVRKNSLDDFDKMITFFILHASRLRLKVITYRKKHKKFHEEIFLSHLNETNIIIDEKDPNQNYPFYTKTDLTFVNQHVL